MHTIKWARGITSGDISTKNSKMTGTSFGLDPWACPKGAKLAKIEGSVCHKCYAQKGTGIYPSVRKGRENNTSAVLRATESPEGMEQWVSAMVFLLEKRNTSGYHRWHDAGDLQNREHLEMILEVARRLPMITFWLPTKESSLVKHLEETPDNLVIRLSGSMIDGKPPKVSKVLKTSTVHHKGEPVGFPCPAPLQGNSCGSCTACYDKSVANVSYTKH